MSLAQNMMINFLKGLGINEALIMGKMDEFTSLVKVYSDHQRQINRRLDLIEQNVALLLRHFEIDEIGEETEKPVDKIKLVNKM